MQSHYEINVSLDGRHLFATAPRSCVTKRDAQTVYRQLAKRFPESEGFAISVTFADCVNRGVSLKTLVGA